MQEAQAGTTLSTVYRPLARSPSAVALQLLSVASQ